MVVLRTYLEFKVLRSLIESKILRALVGLKVLRAILSGIGFNARLFLRWNWSFNREVRKI